MPIGISFNSDDEDDDIIAVIYSATVNRTTKARVKKPGASDFVTKPTNVDVAVETLKPLLQ